MKRLSDVRADAQSVFGQNLIPINRILSSPNEQDRTYDTYRFMYIKRIVAVQEVLSAWCGPNTDA